MLRVWGVLLFAATLTTAVLANDTTTTTGRGHPVLTFAGQRLECPTCRLLCRELAHHSSQPEHQAPEGAARRDPDQYVQFLSRPSRLDSILRNAVATTSSMCVLQRNLLDDVTTQFVHCESATFSIDGQVVPRPKPPKGLREYVESLLREEEEGEVGGGGVRQMLAQEYTKEEMEWSLCVERAKVCPKGREKDL